MASSISLDDFCLQLIDSGLQSAADVNALLQQVQPSDAEQFARWLVKQRRLTQFQAQQ